MAKSSIRKTSFTITTVGETGLVAKKIYKLSGAGPSLRDPATVTAKRRETLAVS